MKSSLLQSISLSEVNDLIIEYKLVEKGYSFEYFIDNYDINKFCFPFGLVENNNLDQREDRPIELISDEQIAYHKFFYNPSINIFISKEHYEEFQKLIRAIKAVQAHNIKIVDISEKQLKHLKDLSKGEYLSLENINSLNDYLSEDFVSILLSLAIGNLSKGIELINKIQNQINPIINSSQNLDCSSHEIATKVLLEWEDEKKPVPPKELSSIVKNCKVYGRISCINKKSIQNKKLFLLLSSSSFNRRELHRLSKNSGFVEKIDKLIFNPCRSVEQIYLKVLLKNIPDPKGTLDKIKNYVEHRNNNRAIEDSTLHIDFKGLIEKLNQEREVFENTSLLLRFEDYEDIIKSLQKKGHTTISKTILALYRLLKDRNSIEELQSKSIDALNFESEFENTIRQGLTDISKNRTAFNILPGKDDIANSYQVLPIVYFNVSSNFKKVLSPIIRFLTDTLVIYQSNPNFIKRINNSFSEIYGSSILKDDFEEELIKIILLIQINKTNTIDPDQLAFGHAKIQLEIIKNTDLEIEYIYVLSWLARRLGLYEVSNKYSNQGLDINPKDPRFHHSKCLTEYCFFKKHKKEDIDWKKNLLKSISEAEKAIKLYKEIQVKVNFVVGKSISALLNTLAFLLTLKYELIENDAFLLVEARELLSKLKFYEASFFYQFPEFLHTEAYLELHEYQAFHNPKKLDWALGTIEQAIKINPDRDYLNLRKEIKKTLN